MRRVRFALFGDLAGARTEYLVVSAVLEILFWT
jgi:hypothetical protein